MKFRILNALRQFGVLLGLGTILLAASGQVSAHHCKGKHANDPGCDSGGGGGEPPPANPAFVYSTGTIHLMDVDGSNQTQIFGTDLYRTWTVGWSPDGNRITFVERNEYPFLHVADADGTNEQEFVTTSNGVEITPNYDLEWRRVDNNLSDRIFFVAGPYGSNSAHSAYFDIYSLDLSTGPAPEAHNLTNFNNVERVDEFSVSPDGSQMVIRYFEDSIYVDPVLQLYSLSVGVSGEIQASYLQDIVPVNNPSESFYPFALTWANQNDMVLYIESNSLFVMDMSTFEVTPLVGGASSLDLGCPRSPTWSPDDSMIAFDIQCHGNKRRLEGIHVVDFISPGGGQDPYVTNVRQLTRGIGEVYLDWRPTWSENP